MPGTGSRVDEAFGQATYPDYANPELLERIPLSARAVLDVGCAQGALGLVYRRRNPRARVLGIDSDPLAADVAASRLSEVACLDVAREPMPFPVSDGLDCIIYGDVLEHLKDPWAVLKAQAEYLAPAGIVLVCMPNVEHWRLALRLLNGTFDYEPSGLLDRSHLRWFTPRSMARTLTEAGLELVDLTSRPIDLDDAKTFTAALAPGLAALGIDPQLYLQRAGPLQFIWRAGKSTRSRIMLRATALPPQGGVSNVRVLEPMQAMRSEASVLAFVQEEAGIPEHHGEMPHIAILHRPLLFGPAGIDRIRTLLAKNYLIVTEFDDHPSFMAERGVDLAGLLNFKGVHAVQTSSPALAALLQAENPEVAVFPNAIFALPAPCNFDDPEALTLFFGALNRSADWASLMPALNEVAALAGARLKFSVAHDQAFFDALETPHKIFTPLCDYPRYLELLGDAEIAFMPLADNPFNRAKSDLKYIEAGACRVVALASPIVYGDVIEDGKTGMLFQDAAELRNHLLRILAFPTAARRIADQARAYVAAERMLAYQVEAREAWYRSLWARRDALNAALSERMPQLFS
jgi:2-polyprenyl-3-methyl-5-hydroxy-6-metoxy-1,4-benzoquinol methylase